MSVGNFCLVVFTISLSNRAVKTKAENCISSYKHDVNHKTPVVYIKILHILYCQSTFSLKTEVFVKICLPIFVRSISAECPYVVARMHLLRNIA